MAPNRIVIVHNGHRLLDETGVRVELLEQDGGETLKVIVDDLAAVEKGSAVAAHRQRFARSLGGLS